ncbi:MAG: protein kinase, partial [Acidobacteriota bacterium]
DELARLNKALAESLGSRYRCVSRLGAGAFGEVYKARDTMLDRDVAIKRVRLDAFADPAQLDEIKRRFLREAKVAAKLKHPNIVTIHDIVETSAMSFIVMEFIDGATLESELKRKKRLSLGETISVLSQTADALDYAHQQTVIHRDVKPANIMIEKSGRVKVTDFGIAKSEASGNITSTGSILGTPNYMSPEQARGESKVDGRSDLFSLGCILFECLSGEKAFCGDSVINILMRIQKEDPEPLDLKKLGLPLAIGEVIRQAVAKDPSKRFPSGTKLIQTLRSIPSPEAKAAAPSLADTVITPPPPPVTRRQPGQKRSFDAELQGSLSEKTLAEVIRELYVNRKTGILHIKRDGVTKRVYFKKGSIIFANSDVNADRLGEFLIRIGEIERSTFDLASQVMKDTGKRFGKTVVDLGYMSDDKMNGLVIQQIEAILFSLFDWDSGQYNFERLDNPVEEDIVLNLSTADTILEGIRRMSSPETIRRALGDLQRVLRHSENPLLLYQKISLTPSEGFVLSRVDGTTTVADIASISPLGEEETLRCVYGLVSAGVAELAKKESGRTSRFRRPSKEKVAIPKPEAASLGSEPRAEPESSGPTPEDLALRNDITTKHASLATATHYDLLEITPTADDVEIKKAYYAMAKKYHPDAHHSPHLRDLHGLLEELFVKMTAAYQLLSNRLERQRYDSSLRTGPGQKTTSPEVGPSTPPPPSGASRSASPKAMAEARYREGKRHFDDMSYFDSIQCLREAVRLNPGKPSYHRLLAKALMKNPKWYKEAEEHFLAALEKDEFDVSSYLGLGELYEGSGLTTRARKMYGKALEYDPDNEVAQGKLYGKTGGARKGLKGLKDMLRGKKDPPEKASKKS